MFPNRWSYLLLLSVLALCLFAARSKAEEMGTRIDVMVVYTPAVTAHRNGHDNVQAHILNSVALANVALENSVISTYFELVHTAEISYVESGSMLTDLALLRGTTDGAMDEVHAWRQEHLADLVVLMRRGSDGTLAGLGYLLTNPNGNPADGFSVVSDSASAASLVMAHELGHNFGAHHDRPNAQSEGIFPDSYGHRFVGSNGITYRTAMTYAPGSLIAHFSNPDVPYAGTPTGMPLPDPQAADNARAIRELSSVVANYRAPPPPPPRPPEPAIFNGSHVFLNHHETFPEGFWIGDGDGAAGTLQLENSTFTSTFGFRFANGENARAALSLQNSTVDSSGATVLMAVGDGSEATVTISPGSVLRFPVGRIGQYGRGVIEVKNGGTLDTQTVFLAEHVGSSAQVTLHGESSLWNANARNVTIGSSGHAEVNVLNGSRMVGILNLAVGGNSSVLNIFGPESLVATAPDEFSSVTINRGAVHVANEGRLVVAESSPTGHILLGVTAVEGQMTVSGGGAISAPGHLRAGIRLGAVSEISVSGSGSTLSIGGEVELGGNGLGTLAIRDGGEVISGSNFSVRAPLLTGVDAISVSGADSRLTVGGSFLLDGWDSVLRVQNNAHVDVTNDLVLNYSDLKLQSGGSLRVLGDVATSSNFILVEDNARIDIEGDVNLRQRSELELQSGGTLQIDGKLNSAWSFLLVKDNARINVTGDMRAWSGGGVELRSGGRLHLEAGLEIGSWVNFLLAGGHLSLAGDRVDFPAEFHWESGTLQTSGTVTGLSHVPADSTLVLNGPSAHLFHEAQAPIALGPNAAIRGGGTVSNLVDLGSDGSGSVSGEGEAPWLALAGGVTGSGTLDKVAISGTILPGRISVNRVQFAPETVLHLEVVANKPHGEISFDATTDLANLTAIITFAGFVPATSDRFHLFHYTGNGSARYNFDAVHAPDGWILRDGMLVHAAAPPVFTAWAEEYQIYGYDALPHADHSGDGFTNLAKFAFGLDPTVLSASLAQVSREDTNLTLRWNQMAQPGIDYLIETSRDLMTWSPVKGDGPAVIEVPATTQPSGYKRVEWSIDETGEHRLSFYRIRAKIHSALLP